MIMFKYIYVYSYEKNSVSKHNLVDLIIHPCKIYFDLIPLLMPKVPHNLL